VLSVLALLVAAQLVLSRYWLDPLDEGYFAELADRVARGELPYRDFATPYTPALHYLHAWAFGLLGRDLVSLRLVLIVAKSGLFLLLYALGRRLMPPAFAALPILLLVGLDTVPFMWEPHPAWYALALSVLAVWSVVRLIETGLDRWTLLAGAAAGLACGFKQNIGLFLVMATVGFLLFHGSDLPAGSARVSLPAGLTRSRIWFAARLAYVLLLAVALTWLLREYLEPHVAFVFLGPLLGLVLVGLASERKRVESLEQREATAGRLVLFSFGWLALVLVWLLPLAVGLGPHGLPVGQFLGRLDLQGYHWDLLEPRPGVLFFMLAAIACPLAIQRLCRPGPVHHRLVGSAAFLVAAVVAADAARVDSALAAAAQGSVGISSLRLSLYAAEGLLMYLPTVSFWTGVIATATAATSLRPSASLVSRWYLLAGALLLFNLFPRMDAMHITYSAPVLFISGSFALYCFYRRLQATLDGSAVAPLASLLLYGGLLLLPAATMLPNLEWRASALFVGEGDQRRFEPPDYVSLGLPGAGVLVRASTRDNIGRAAQYVAERTEPGEPMFAYPTVPVFYFLADRPNPTRFGHLFPGAATEVEQQELILALERSSVRYVIWDQYWVDEWGRDGKHTLNQAVTDYILSRYRLEATFGPLHVLARSE
jgi:hypothetical protein